MTTEAQRPSTLPALALPNREQLIAALRKPNIARDVLPLLALIALIGYFSLRAEAFRSPANFALISGQAGILLLASLGATLVIAGSIDLSVGSIALLTGTVVAYLIR